MSISRSSVILALAAILLHAQGPKGGSSAGGTTPVGTTGGTTGTTGTPSTGNFPSTNTNGTANSTTNPGTNTRGAFYFGTVVMPDGTAPPVGVVIEKVCNGSLTRRSLITCRRVAANVS